MRARTTNHHALIIMGLGALVATATPALAETSCPPSWAGTIEVEGGHQKCYNGALVGPVIKAKAAAPAEPPSRSQEYIDCLGRHKDDLSACDSLKPKGAAPAAPAPVAPRQLIKIDNRPAANAKAAANPVQANSVTQAIMGRSPIAWTGLQRFGFAVLVPFRFQLKYEGPGDARQAALAAGVGLELHGGIFSLMNKRMPFSWYAEIAWLRGIELQVTNFDVMKGENTTTTGGNKADHLIFSAGLDIIASGIASLRLGYVLDSRAAAIAGPNDALLFGYPSSVSHGFRLALGLRLFGVANQLAFDIFDQKESYYPTNPDFVTLAKSMQEFARDGEASVTKNRLVLLTWTQAINLL